MTDKTNWGLIATGAIAKAFARGLRQSQTGHLLAVASRSQEKADAFAREFNCPKAYACYEDLLADPDIQAVYISTPHPMHPEWTIRAAEAGKHVLVEKPVALNQYQAEAMVNAAMENNVFLMEAYMYRCHPQTRRLVELIRGKTIGDVRVISATFSFQAGFNPESRIWSNALGGGGILDVGGYTTSICRLIAGAALDRPFADPLSVTGAGHLHPETGADAWAVGTLKFPGDIVATISTGVGVGQDNVVRIYGSEGDILLANPYVAARDGGAPSKIIVNRRGKPAEEIDIESPITSFAHEADVCGRAIMDGRTEAPSPAMTWADTLGNIRTQDAWRDAIGLVYESEKPENYTPGTAANRPLTVRQDSTMAYGNMPHLAKPVSRLIMGVDNQVTMSHATAMFDDYFERGGNAFDTAYVYGQLKSSLLGRWVQTNNIRERVVLIAKGAHTPHCNPEALTTELKEQLDWLGTDHADIYLMHRDNPDIPVGEFVDALNEHVKAGRIKSFGGSNWSLARVRAANAYAESRGLQGFGMVSNNLSLAEMAQPVWGGCIHVHDAEDREWFRETQTPLLPWSSQARGFFVPERAGPDKQEDSSLVKSWYSADNFRRQGRAIELAGKYNVEPINIALAWVLCQPFPTFPLIGPRHVAETRSCMRALDIRLTEQELNDLNLTE